MVNRFNRRTLIKGFAAGAAGLLLPKVEPIAAGPVEPVVVEPVRRFWALGEMPGTSPSVTMFDAGSQMMRGLLTGFQATSRNYMDDADFSGSRMRSYNPFDRDPAYDYTELVVTYADGTEHLLPMGSSITLEQPEPGMNRFLAHDPYGNLIGQSAWAKQHPKTGYY